ncbi:hypothetical protein D3C78_1914880 [compost metagenome]
MRSDGEGVAKQLLKCLFHIDHRKRCLKIICWLVGEVERGEQRCRQLERAIINRGVWPFLQVRDHA